MDFEPPSRTPEHRRIMYALAALKHGGELVDVIWYPRAKRVIARLRDNTCAVYTDDGEYVDDQPIHGQRGYQVAPPTHGIDQWP